MSSSFWVQCLVLEGSTGELHWVIHAWILLDRVSFGRAQPYFSPTIWL
jgi:hypothetical protein